jgi:pyridoxine 4-dehydrogenase
MDGEAGKERRMSVHRSIELADVGVPRIGLGTNQLTNTPEHVRFIRAAVDAGIRHIDTAFLYTGGQSEEAIGAARSVGLEGCVIATKGGYAAGQGRPDVLRGQLDESLRRLGTDAIDLYYLHRVHPDTPLEESIGALKEQRDAGKVRHVGLSQVGIDEIERARAIVPIAAVQNEYHLSARGWDDVVDHCAREGIVFVPYYPMRGGGPSVDRVAASRGVTSAQIRLAWLLHRSPIILPIPGTLSLEHAEANLRALNVELTDEEFAQLTE